jgi:hypothetical protein
MVPQWLILSLTEGHLCCWSLVIMMGAVYRFLCKDIHFLTHMAGTQLDLPEVNHSTASLLLACVLVHIIFYMKI